jgi:hypothetical protein
LDPIRANQGTLAGELMKTRQVSDCLIYLRFNRTCARVRTMNPPFNSHPPCCFAANQGFQERGENLEKLEDRTEKMMNEASSYRELSTQLLNKYKDRKWYHF